MILKKISVYIIFIIVFLFCGCKMTDYSDEEGVAVPNAMGDFEISVLSVGKADAIVLDTKKHCIVIDCGEKGDGKKILDKLEQKGITSIDYLFITHFDKDHIGGAAKVIKNIEVKRIIVPNYEGSNDEYKSFLKAAEECKITPSVITEIKRLILDDILLEIYPPEKRFYGEGDNDFSLAIGISHGKNKFLFAGDAEEERTTELMSELEGDYDFLKVPHHGRYDANTEEFIRYISPKYSVITDSEKNPADIKTINTLSSCGSEIYYTRNGDVSVISDGKNIKVTNDL